MPIQSAMQCRLCMYKQWVNLICLWWVISCTVIIHICCEVMLHVFIHWFFPILTRPYWVIFQSACIQQWVNLSWSVWRVMTCTIIIHICCKVMLHTLIILPNFDFYLCLRVKFHESSFWVLILAAGGPYWVLISQKNGSLLGPYIKARGSLLVLEAVQNLPSERKLP